MDHPNSCYYNNYCKYAQIGTRRWKAPRTWKLQKKKNRVVIEPSFSLSKPLIDNPIKHNKESHILKLVSKKLLDPTINEYVVANQKPVVLWNADYANYTIDGW